MAKKVVFEEVKHPMALEDILSDRFARYSKYIIQERALPDARDGLKPVQRRILYAMYHEGNIAERAYRKSAKTVGIVIGNYHPHGDSSVYDAMVRMSQNWKMNHQLVDMHGNNGSIDDDPAAAMRYTEARLAPISMSMLKDLDYKTVLMAPNFDDTENEPTVLPSQFPLLLVNGATGIAAGYATNIAPHNLGEVINATIYCIAHSEATTVDVMQFMHGPDFPTGGIVQGKQQIQSVFETGKGRVVVRAKTEFVQTKTIKQIHISEIPYEVIKSNLVKKMDEIRINKDIDGMMDVRDESDRNGLKIVVDIKKDADEQLILNYLLKNTDLQVYYNYNMVAIINKRPQLCGVLNLIRAFIAHREEVVLTRSRYLVAQIENRLNILEGLIKAVSIMDDVIALIRSSKDKQDAKTRLMEAFLFNEIQAEAIVTLRLYRLTNTDVAALRSEFAKLISEMEELKAIISNKNVLHSVISNELKEIAKQYATPRKTMIQDEVEEIVIDKIKMIANEKVMITLSQDGYLKRVSLRSYTASENQMTGLKEGDRLIGTKEAETLDTLLLFTNKGNYGYLPIYQMDEAKWKDVGQHINHLMKMKDDEKIIDAILVKNFDSYAFVVSVSKQGMIKKTFIKDYILQRNSKLSQAMKLKTNDEVVKVFVVYPNQDIVLTTQDGYTSRYNESILSNLGVKSQGVKAMNLSKQDFLASAIPLANNETYVALFDNGKMKRMKNDELSLTSRPVKGERMVKRFKSNNPLIIETMNVTIYNHLTFFDETSKMVQAKDIPLMSKDASFSSPVELSPGFYYLREIQELMVVDCPKDYQMSQEEEVVVSENVMEPLL
ncbi:MAG: DNA topoisomerase IV subunit A [Erysipelotrichaceae bacterium]